MIGDNGNNDETDFDESDEDTQEEEILDEDAMPTIVLPAPQGRTMTPLPPCACPPAWKTSAASC